MTPTVMWTVVAILVIAVMLITWFAMRKRRTEALRGRFGPEYDRVVRTTGDVRRAETALESRAKRVEKLHIRPLAPEAAAQYAEAWRRVQVDFVDNPKESVTEADRLIGEVMNARGYPLGDFERRIEDISVDHPNVVINYRAAREIAEQHQQGKASTEDLRQAMIHYRALFRELLETAQEHPVVSEDEPTRSGR